MTDGRFRLGVGVGWNAVEYEALGEAFDRRGRRMDEQIPLLRRLWTERAVTHDGPFDRVTGAGLAPLPTQRPIPIWIGGQSPPAYRRVGTARRRLVPAGAAGTEARRGPGHRGGRRGAAPDATPPSSAWRAA